MIENETHVEQDESVARKLDEKLMELHSLFELSQTLNSSLNVTSILDNLLLTPMGKMMIGKGIVLLQSSPGIYSVNTHRGLHTDLLGQKIRFDFTLEEPTFVKDISEDDDEKLEFFKNLKIDLLIPIRKGQNQVLGLVGFGKKLTGQAYIQAELDFLRSLSNMAATAIENSLMVLQLQEVNRKLDKKVQELNTLFDIGKELNSSLDADKIVNLLSYAIMGEMMVNRCVVFLKDDSRMELVSSKGHRSQTDLTIFQDDITQAALLNAKDTIDLYRLDTPEPWHQLLIAEGIQVIVPMQLHNETRGIIGVGEKIPKTDYDQDELDFLFTLGNEAMICLENARLFEEMIEKQRMEEELEIAREIQQGLLPALCPSIDGFEISAINIPSQQVGGDYYDCMVLPDGRVCLAIADVSGKGIPASLLMANMQASLHATVDTAFPLKDITAKINNIIHRNTGYDKFITFFCSILDVKTRKLVSVNAGHNPPYLFHQDGSFELLKTGGLLLGMLPNMPYDQETTTLVSGDWIVMYTDGISEAKNASDEDFEEYRIEEVIKAHLDASTDEMRDFIQQRIREFTQGMPQSDDITMIIVKVL
ncbi:SpoIIE family protein phosphatase [candidate division KSB1 bacterium]|nr:SpoIIE family protein phosphatase [candidate division KSB1 bacterium]